MFSDIVLYPLYTPYMGYLFPLIKLCYFLKINKNCFIYGAWQETCFVKNYSLTNPFGCPIFYAVFVIVLFKALKGNVHFTSNIVMMRKRPLWNIPSATQLSLTYWVLRKVVKEMSSAGLWLWLESCYMIGISHSHNPFVPKVLATLFGWKKELIPVSKHFDEFDRIIFVLKIIDCKVNDKGYVSTFLCLLPPPLSTLLIPCCTISIDFVKDVRI